jgi:hypothetical protein
MYQWSKNPELPVHPSQQWRCDKGQLPSNAVEDAKSECLSAKVNLTSRAKDATNIKPKKLGIKGRQGLNQLGYF